jgi:hypothetical protein
VKNKVDDVVDKTRSKFDEVIDKTKRALHQKVGAGALWVNVKGDSMRKDI